MIEVSVRRELLERAIGFLKQYAEKLELSDYPPDSYKLDSIEDIVTQLERCANG